MASKGSKPTTRTRLRASTGTPHSKRQGAMSLDRVKSAPVTDVVSHYQEQPVYQSKMMQKKLHRMQSRKSEEFNSVPPRSERSRSEDFVIENEKQKRLRRSADEKRRKSRSPRSKDERRLRRSGRSRSKPSMTAKKKKSASLLDQGNKPDVQTRKNRASTDSFVLNPSSSDMSSSSTSSSASSSTISSSSTPRGEKGDEDESAYPKVEEEFTEAETALILQLQEELRTKTEALASCEDEAQDYMYKIKLVKAEINHLQGILKQQIQQRQQQQIDEGLLPEPSVGLKVTGERVQVKGKRREEMEEEREQPTEHDISCTALSISLKQPQQRHLSSLAPPQPSSS